MAGIKFLADLDTQNPIQFQNSSGTDAGKIEMDGDDLVLSNALGDVLFGDADSDIYIGDGVNSVDILFEQSGSIKAEDGSSGVTLTLGSSDTTLSIYAPKITNLSTQSSEATALMINGSNVVGTRELGSLAFVSNISNSNWSGTDLAIANGGTGASTASAARTNLGLGTAATANSTSFASASHTHAASDITSGTFATARIPDLSSTYIKGSTQFASHYIYLNQNPVGTTYGDTVSTVPSYYYGQKVGDNDGWRLYGEAPASNDVKMIFEIIDDIESGDTWVFRNKKTYSPYTANDVVVIGGDGDIDTEGDITLDGRLRIGTVDSNTSSTSALVLNGTEVEKRTLGSNAFNSTSFLTSVNNSNWSGTDLSIANGGTGASTASAARTNLGLGTAATSASTDFVAVSGDTVTGNIKFNDNVRLDLGSSSDLRMYHSGTDGVIQNETGQLFIQNTSDDKDIIFRSDDGNGGLTEYFRLDGSHTQSVASKNIRFNDNISARFGSGDDLRIYHNGSNSYVSDTGTGNLYLQGSNTLVLEAANGENYLYGAANGAVGIYYDNSEKLTTSSTGITVTGEITTTGGNSTNWNTAYGWGNHASAGYLTAHPNISAASSVNNSNRTYIQDITVDSNGHVTGITSATETVTDTNTQLSNEQVQDIVGAMFSGNTETGLSASYQDSDGTIDLAISNESIQDIVGAMFSGNTETNITATYQDADGTIDLVATNTTYSTATSSTLGLVKIGYTENGKNYPVELSSGQMYVNVPWTDTNTNTQLSNEQVQDIVGAMVSSNTETNISVTYDDTNGKLNFAATDTNTQLTDAQVRSKISGTGLISYNSSTGVISTTANNYVHPTGAGNKHIPSGGAAGQFLKYSSSGTAVWATPSYTTNTDTVTSVGTSGNESSGVITIAGSGATSVSQSGGTITISSTDTNTTYSNATTSAAGLMSSTDKSKLNGIAASANNYSLPAGSSTVRGGFKIGYTENGKNYPVEVSSEQMYVNVPWTDTNTTYSTATSSTLGLVKIGYTENGKNYPVELSSGQMYVNVPWTDTNTTYSVGDGGLTQKNFTTTLKTKLDGIATSADNYSNWNLLDNADNTNRIDSNEYVKFSGADISGTGTSSDPFIVTTPNTTYTADGNYGMTLNGTAFRLENDRRRNSSTQDIHTGNTHDYTFYDADVGIRWYTAGAEEMRLEDDGDLHVDGDVIAFSTTVSDERLKDDVETIENASEKVSKLRGVEYTWNEGSRKGQREIGVIAQEVEEVVPEIVHEKTLPFAGDKTYKTVDYEKLVALLIESNKEQQEIIAQLEERIIDLENRL